MPCPTRTRWRRCLPGPEPRLHLPAGFAAEGSDLVSVTPARAGWAFAGLRVVRLGRGESRALETGDSELVVLPLSGSCVVRVEGQRFLLEGRTSVFERV